MLLIAGGGHLRKDPGLGRDGFGRHSIASGAGRGGWRDRTLRQAQGERRGQGARGCSRRSHDALDFNAVCPADGLR